MQSEFQSYVLKLSDDGSQPKTGIYSLPEGSILVFSITAGAKCNVFPQLFTNYPVHDHTSFHRSTFHQILGSTDVVGHWSCSTEIRLPGAFSFYITYENADSTRQKAVEGHFLCTPVLSIKASAAEFGSPSSYPSSSTGLQTLASSPSPDIIAFNLPREAICMQTVVTKNLPPVQKWATDLFPFVKTCGFNMLHFTPVQELGTSQSGYSIRDQLSLSQRFLGSSSSSSYETQCSVLKKSIQDLERQCACLSIVDIVLNHTADNSEWLEEFPNAGFSTENSPHLRAAYELDNALYQLSLDLTRGRYGRIGPPPTPSSPHSACTIESHADLDHICALIRTQVLDKLSLHEYYAIDIPTSISNFRACLMDASIAIEKGLHWSIPESEVGSHHDWTFEEKVKYLKQHGLVAQYNSEERRQSAPGSQRFPFISDLNVVAVLFVQKGTKPGHVSSEAIFWACEELKNALEALQADHVRLFKENECEEIIRSIRGTVEYERLAYHGPKMGAILPTSPLVQRYFTVRKGGEMAFANNGWVMGVDQDFVAPHSRAFLLRRVVIWSDCVKLNYGPRVLRSEADIDPRNTRIAQEQRDQLGLWNRMRTYCQSLASIFAGFRIDNAHSTPIHVAQEMLDAARQVNPKLYIIAELFTENLDTEVRFVTELGVNALIRENMQAHSPAEISHFIHTFGDHVPVGSFDYPRDRFLRLLSQQPQQPQHFIPSSPSFEDGARSSSAPISHASSFASLSLDPLSASSPMYGQQRQHVSFSAIEHGVEDSLKQSASLSLPIQFKGSHTPAILFDCTHDNETPFTKRTAEDTLPNAALAAMACCALGSVRGYDEIYADRVHLLTENRLYAPSVSTSSGIVAARGILNRLHAKLASEGYSEMYIEMKASPDLICITRSHPRDLDQYICISRSAFPHGSGGWQETSVEIQGDIERVVLAARMVKDSCVPYEKHSKVLTGLPITLIRFEDRIASHIDIESNSYLHTTKLKIQSSQFPPGTVLILHIRPAQATQIASSFLNEHIMQAQSAAASASSSYVFQDLVSSLSRLSLVDMNHLLFRCEEEERDASPGHSRNVFHLHDHGPLAYAGLCGIVPLLDRIRESKDMGHPLCSNLRMGDWLMDYTLSRLADGQSQFSPLCSWLETVFGHVKSLARPLIPKYFDAVVSLVYEQSMRHIFTLITLPFSLASSPLVGLLHHRESALLVESPSATPSYGMSPVPSLPSMPTVRSVTALVVPAVISSSTPSSPSLSDIHLPVSGQEHDGEDRSSKPWAPSPLLSIAHSDEFITSLALTSVALIGRVPSAPILKPEAWMQSNGVSSPLAQISRFFHTVQATLHAPEGLGPPPHAGIDLTAALAAGLPHFSVGYMRNWGRDTFISFRGMLLIPNRFREARSLLLGYAACVRHGLIPNLLDSGFNPRFNARDAVWWYLQALQEYTKFAPEGNAILEAPVFRLFPTDTQALHSTMPKEEIPLAEIVYEIMQKHFDGISFREWNAGTKIDDRMQDEGFEVRIRIDLATGFVYGGNRFNCGTWMDKMGESKNAGNWGLPATPRDGADIELIGLLKSTVSWLAKLHNTKTTAGSSSSGNADGSSTRVFPYEGVSVVGDRLAEHLAVNRSLGIVDAAVVRAEASRIFKAGGSQRLRLTSSTFTFEEWAARIERSFEKYFWVPVSESEDADYHVDKSLINKRGIYKDVQGCSQPWCDYQLRPNLCVAMAVAPELFNKEHAAIAVAAVEKYLLGPLGMKTLDPEDWAYRGNYDNATDSQDFTTSRGFNYHQGPEWVWCIGYFLRALIHFSPLAESKDNVRHHVMRILSEHRKHMASDLALGLPELTNRNGAVCPYSCSIQAWSMATILDALHDLFCQ